MWGRRSARVVVTFAFRGLRMRRRTFVSLVILGTPFRITRPSIHPQPRSRISSITNCSSLLTTLLSRSGLEIDSRSQRWPLRCGEQLRRLNSEETSIVRFRPSVSADSPYPRDLEDAALPQSGRGAPRVVPLQAADLQHSALWSNVDGRQMQAHRGFRANEVVRAERPVVRARQRGSFRRFGGTSCHRRVPRLDLER